MAYDLRNDKEMEVLGKKIIALLQLKAMTKKEDKKIMYNTAIGTKTAQGIARTISRLINFHDDFILNDKGCIE